VKSKIATLQTRALLSQFTDVRLALDAVVRELRDVATCMLSDEKPEVEARR